MSHEYSQAPLEHFFLDLVPPSEKEPDYWLKAKHLATLCSEMDNDPDKISILDPRIDPIKQALSTTAASPAYNAMLGRRVNNYLQADGTTNFGSMLERMGVQIDQGLAGIFTKEGAKRIELRELLIYGPTVVESLKKNGEMESLRIEMLDQREISAGFSWHYGERFDDTANLDVFLPTNDTKNRWYDRRKKMQIYTVFPKEISDIWVDPPAYRQPELFCYPEETRETIAESLSYAIIR